MDLSRVTEVLDECYKRKAVNFYLEPRLCYKHMRKFIKGKGLKDGDADVVQLMGACSKCTKMGIVYYLDWKEKREA